MKKTLLLIVLQLAAFALCAQKNENTNVQRKDPVNPLKDKQDYQGFTIRLLPAIPVTGGMAAYAFDILKDNQPVLHRFQNPLPLSPKGIQKKDDAYKIAQWMIQDYKKTGKWPYVIQPRIAQEL